MGVTIKSAIAEGCVSLEKVGVREARNEAGLLMMHVLQRDRTFLIAHSDEPLVPDQHEQFRSLVSRRGAGEPLQYLTGHQEFFRLDFEVTPDVLIPRPETELIVQVGLEVLKHAPEPYVLDIGTGSGCIAISLLHELRNARAVATDLSPAALALARRNAERHHVIDRLQLIESDLFSAVGAGAPFELIVSNPPYVPEQDLAGLQREVRHEPRGALEGGSDGLSIIRRLLKEAPRFLHRGGYLVFEIGFDQSGPIKQAIDMTVWRLVELREDLQGIPRAVVLQKS